MTEKVQVQILGIGSPFGADEIGWQVVEALQNGSVSQPESLTVIFETLDRPGADLVAYLEKEIPTVIVDAMVSGAPLGSIRCWGRDETLPAGALLSSHGFGVAQAVEMARALDALPNSLLIIGIEINPSSEVVNIPDMECVKGGIDAFFASIL